MGASLANPEHVAKLKEGIAAWNKWREENPRIRPDLTRLDFNQALIGTDMWGGPWDDEKRVDLGASPGWYEGPFRPPVNFSKVDLWLANLSGARLEAIDFRRARLTGANLSRADLWGADIRMALLRGANLTEARLSGVVYTRRELLDKCRGIQGVGTTHGYARLSRDLLDQDYIDNQRFLWKTPPWNPARFLMLWPWSFFDYGRGWHRVAIFAVFLIALFGYGYQLSVGVHIDFTHSGATVHDAFYPWFVASMGFATLGISDLVEPKDIWGQALMIGNVTAGFVTLGLLLSVLGNSFGRRA